MHGSGCVFPACSYDAAMNIPYQHSAGRQAWTAFTICTVIYLFTFLYRMAPATMALDIASDLGIGLADMSIVGSATILGFGIMQLPCGLLSDRIGGKRTLVLLTLLAGASTLWLGMAQSLGSVAMSRFLTGAGASATIPCIAILARQFSPEMFARVSTTMYGCGTLGTIAAAAPLAWACAHIGWRDSMLVCGALSLLMATLLLLLVRERPPAALAAASPAHQQPPLSACLAKVLSSRPFWMICIVYSGVMIAFFGFYGLWFGPYLVQACGLSKIEAGTVLSAGAFAGFIGMPGAGFLSDILRSRKKVLIPLTCTSAACIAVLAVFAGSLPVWGLTVLAAVFVFCNGSAGLCFTCCKELFPLSMLGAATGCFNTLPPLLGAASQQMFGILLETAQHSGLDTPSAYSLCMLLYAGVMVLAAAASFFTLETHPAVYSAEEQPPADRD